MSDRPNEIPGGARGGGRNAGAQPPRLARRFLRWWLPVDERDGALDALDEKFNEVAASGEGPWRASRWYWRQVAGLLHPRFWKRGPDRLLEGQKGKFGMIWTQDVRFGARMLAKNRGMTVVILVTLAVGIGFNGAVFSLLNTIVLNDLPVEGADRLLFVDSDNLSEGRESLWVSYPDYRDFYAANHSFESLAAWSGRNLTLSDGVGAPERYVGALVTPSMFDVLRVEPQLGRRFEEADSEPGAEAVAIMGHGVWQTRYGGDPGILGNVVRISGEPTTIVGVLPKELEQTPFDPDVWEPLVRSEALERNRSGHFLLVVGRLRDGVTASEADAEFKRLAGQLEIEFPETNEGVGARVEAFVERFGETPNVVIAWVMMGAVGFLLLIACANVANLLVSRSVQRGREVAIRSALGASRWRVIRQLLVESLLLSLLGGVGAAALAVWGARALEGAIMGAVPPVFWDFSVQPSVYVFIIALSVGTSLVFGLAPALQATRGNVSDTLKDGGRSSGGGGARRLTGSLVVVQIALALVLLAGAGVMIRSAINIQRVDWGLDPEGVLTMRLNLTPAAYPDTENLIAFHEDLEQRLRRLPGAESVALASSFPSRGSFTVPVELENLPIADGNPPQSVSQIIVSATYFELADVTPVRGRFFTEADGLEGDPVVVVEQRFADRFWPDADPIGRRLRWVGETERRWMRVVGVTPNIRQSLGAEFLPDYPVIYTPYKQEPLRTIGLMVRSEMDPESLATLLRQEVQQADPDLPLFSIASLDELLYQSTVGWQIMSFLFFLLGAIALFLSCLGVYSVMAFAVGRRQQEIGIRMALGARSGEVVRLVVHGALRQTIVGLVLGLAGALATTRLIGMFMYEVSPNDPMTFVLTLALLLGTALLASILPARRASRVDPLLALRSE